VRERVLQRVLAVLDGDLPPDVLGRPTPVDVGLDVGGERAAGAERGAPAAAQRELGVALRLLLEGHGEDAVVLPCGHVRGGDNTCGGPHRARGVDTQEGLPGAPEGVGEVELRLHDPFEQVGGLAHHHGVNVGHCHVGVVKGPEGCLADQPGVGDVQSPRLVVGLADADDGTRSVTHESPSSMQIKFCCRHGPEVAWASARRPWPKMWSAA
jgi:hypothetical protein